MGNSKALNISDFECIKLENYYSYWKYCENGFQICLEPCLNGFDVAIYDSKQNLLEDKYCTNIVIDGQDSVLEAIVSIRDALIQANILYKKYICK